MEMGLVTPKLGSGTTPIKSKVPYLIDLSHVRAASRSSQNISVNRQFRFQLKFRAVDMDARQELASSIIAKTRGQKNILTIVQLSSKTNLKQKKSDIKR